MQPQHQQLSSNPSFASSSPLHQAQYSTTMQQHPRNIASAASTSAPAATSSSCVHVLYDYASLPRASPDELNALLTQCQKLASSCGDTITCTIPFLTQSLDSNQQRVCREHPIGAHLEEIAPSAPSSETFLLTRLLRLTLELQAAGTTALRTSVILLSNHSALTSSVSLMRQSSLFTYVILIHDASATEELRAAASHTLTIEEFMAGKAPKPQQHHPTEEKKSQPMPLNATTLHLPPVQVPPHHPPQYLASASQASPPGFHNGLPPSFHRPTQLTTSPTDAESNINTVPLLGMNPSGYMNSPHTLSPNHPLPLLPTPPANNAGSPSMRFLGPPQLQPSPYNKKIASSAPSSPTSRTFFPFPMPGHGHQSPHAPLMPGSTGHTPQAAAAAASASVALGGANGGYFHQRGSSDRVHSTSFHSSSSAARTRACLSTYSRIIAYCETEKLIPRESVLKKRLVDSKLQLGDVASGIEFEEFLACIISSGAGVMEGEAPQRIIWPRGADGQARHFACADFFTPVSRLSPEQNSELLEFLYAVQPEVERGRFGFANWLSLHGPPFVRLLPHGVLVELVQLLLNRKVLLFRKGKVSVASRSEANEAASLGLLFSASDFQTPAQSRVPSPAISRAATPDLSEAASTIWDPHQDDWRNNSMQQTNNNNSAYRRSSLNAPMFQPSSLASPNFALPPHGGGSSYSTPVTRAASPIPTVASSMNAAGTAASSHPIGTGEMVRMRGGESGGMHQKRRSISSLQPLTSATNKPFSTLPPNRGGTYEQQTAAQFDALSQSLKDADFGGGGSKSLWSKDERSNSIGGSASSSAFPSRRASMDDSWRLASGSGSSAPFESSTGFSGESFDACDPAAVLAVKLAHLNSEHIAQSTNASTDELTRFTAAVQYRPCFHFEKSGAAHTPEWVCLVAFMIGTKRYQMRSNVHNKKDLAKNEVCMRVLQMIEDESITLAPHTDTEREGDVVDSVIDLARLLNFLQQSPVVYYLTRSQAPAAGRYDSRNIGARRNSSGGSNIMWNGSTRIQVKSVNVITGEAQPTVSASTPFTHTVVAATKHEAKEIIAANLLQQIHRARVVNPALFTVLSAARHNLAQQPHPQQQQPQHGVMNKELHQQQHQQQPQHGVLQKELHHQSQQQQPAQEDSILWHQTSNSHLAPIGAPSSYGQASVAPVDMSRMPNPNSSLFSLHTPVPGRPFSGISAIGLETPTTPQYVSHGSLPTHFSTLDQVSEDVPMQNLSSAIPTTMPPPMMRSISETMNQAAELTSTASAESALKGF